MRLSPPIAILYEVVEELKQDDGKRVVDVSTLIGSTPLGTPACPKNKPDYAYVDTTDGQPNGRCIDVRSDELLLGVPMVRFEISF